MGLEGRMVEDNIVMFGQPLNEKALNALKKRSPTAESIIKSLPKSAFLSVSEEQLYSPKENLVEEPEAPIKDLAAERKAAKKQKSKVEKEQKMNLEKELEMLEQEVVESENKKVLEEPVMQAAPEMKDQILDLLSSDPNAPSEEQVAVWKEQYGKNGVHVMAFGEDDIYIYHHLTRGEWKKIKDIMNRLKDSGKDGDEVEERLKEKVVMYCVFYPFVDEKWLEYCKAGVMDSLYQMILLNSGFLTPQQAMLLTTQL
jgi:hypothetical protein